MAPGPTVHTGKVDFHGIPPSPMPHWPSLSFPEPVTLLLALGPLHTLSPAWNSLTHTRAHTHAQTHISSCQFLLILQTSDQTSLSPEALSDFLSLKALLDPLSPSLSSGHCCHFHPSVRVSLCDLSPLTDWLVAPKGGDHVSHVFYRA